MSDSISTISTLLSYMTTLFFWGGLVLIIAMLRGVMKDVADIKKTLAAIEETTLLAPRPEFQSSTKSE